MTADGQPVRNLHRSGDGLSSEDAAPRRRHSPAHPAAQRSRSVSPVLDLPPTGPQALHDTPSDADSSDDEQQLLHAGARASGGSRTRQLAADSGPTYQLAFDGVEGGDGPLSSVGAVSSGAFSTLVRRHLPGLALFWDGITPELIAVSMGEAVLAAQVAVAARSRVPWSRRSMLTVCRCVQCMSSRDCST
jgi:hypothetical protein